MFYVIEDDQIRVFDSKVEAVAHYAGTEEYAEWLAMSGVTPEDFMFVERYVAEDEGELRAERGSHGPEVDEQIDRLLPEDPRFTKIMATDKISISELGLSSNVFTPQNLTIAVLVAMKFKDLGMLESDCLALVNEKPLEIAAHLIGPMPSLAHSKPGSYFSGLIEIASRVWRARTQASIEKSVRAFLVLLDGLPKEPTAASLARLCSKMEDFGWKESAVMGAIHEL